MDPVSRALAEIERHRPRLLPFAVFAVVLHLAAVVSIVLLGQFKPGPKAAHLPTVAVRLVTQPRPQPPRSPAAAARRTQPTPAPQPTMPPPEATAVPRPTAPPVEQPRAETPSEEAMPSLDATPVPTRAPAPSESQGASGVRGRGGLSLGGDDGGSGGEPGIPSDFQFSYYIDRMLALIESRWFKPPVPAGTSARARFTILRDGQVQGIALEEPSGYPTFDRAVLRALYAANPLPPLPPAYLKSRLTVHLRFADNG